MTDRTNIWAHDADPAALPAIERAVRELDNEGIHSINDNTAYAAALLMRLRLNGHVLMPVADTGKNAPPAGALFYARVGAIMHADRDRPLMEMQPGLRTVPALVDYLRTCAERFPDAYANVLREVMPAPPAGEYGRNLRVLNTLSPTPIERT